MSSEVTSAGQNDPASLIPPDRTARREASRLIADLHGDFGRVADLGVWVAGVQRSAPPQRFRRIRAIQVASRPAAPASSGDRDLAESALDASAGRLGVTRRTVEVVAELSGGPRVELPELSQDEFHAAYELGRFVADEEADAGTDLLILGVHPATRQSDLTGAAAVSATLLGREPVAMIGTDSATGSATGMDDRGWMQRVTATRDALRRVRRRPAPDPMEVVRLVGGARIAVLTGLLRQSSLRRTPVLLDGSVVSAAALTAGRLEPGSQRWWRAAIRSPEPAADAALADLGLRPLLDLGVRADDGSGGLLALPLIEAAIDLLGALSVGTADR
jgi:nicotinate-nucleotide--dimethylbenzimidazole phosphoribosyltransferase